MGNLTTPHARHNTTSGDHDLPDVTVRLVRAPDGSTSLVAIRNALAWVIRRPFLFTTDVD